MKKFIFKVRDLSFKLDKLITVVVDCPSLISAKALALALCMHPMYRLETEVVEINKQQPTQEELEKWIKDGEKDPQTK